VKILVLPKGDTRMLESSFHSDNIAATNFLSSDNEVSARIAELQRQRPPAIENRLDDVKCQQRQ
jgi:hypothetical protein